MIKFYNELSSISQNKTKTKCNAHGGATVTVKWSPDVGRLHPLGSMKKCTEFHGKIADIYRDQSDGSINRQM